MDPFTAQEGADAPQPLQGVLQLQQPLLVFGRCRQGLRQVHAGAAGIEPAHRAGVAQQFRQDGQEIAHFAGNGEDGLRRPAFDSRPGQLPLILPVDDTEPLLPLDLKMQNARLPAPVHDPRQGADAGGRGPLPNLPAAADQANAEILAVTQAGADHVEVTGLKNAQGEQTLRKQHGAEQK